MAALVSHRPATELGSLHFNRVRMIVATLIMGTLIIVSGRPVTIPQEFWLPIALSAVTGVVLGDFFLFVTMRRLGPRRRLLKGRRVRGVVALVAAFSPNSAGTSSGCPTFVVVTNTSKYTAAQPAPRRVRHKIVTNGFSLYENGFYDIESLKLADRSMLTSEPLSIKLGIALKIVEKISDL